MGIVGTCWYLCGLFAAVAAIASAVTVVPDGERIRCVAVATFLFVSALFALAAVICQRRAVNAPAWLVRVVQGVAVLATLFLLFGVIG